MAEKVFISYSHQDSVCGHGIARYLTRHGLDVWIDSEKLTLGSSWSNDIEEAIAKSDVVIGILSASSLRRKEVLKEINIALKRMENESIENFRLLFVVIGQIHSSWFKDKDSVQGILDYLNKYQYIELSAYGEVTIDAMKNLLSAIKQKGIDEINKVEKKNNEDDDAYINQSSVPEKAFDNVGNNLYYKTFPADLSSSTVYPFALDNQWIPEELYDSKSDLYDDFEQRGFLDEKIDNLLTEYKRKNFYLPFFHAKQVIIKRNSLTYSPYFKKLLLSESEDKNAFIDLLKNGSIVVFLYGNKEFTPFIHHVNLAEDKQVTDEWNKICSQVAIYCIRENWSAQLDQHSVEFLRFCSNMAIDRENNVLLARNMHLSKEEIDEFLITLKTISMQAFCQTHMNGTEGLGKVDAYSRSIFYRNYIVKSHDESGKDPVYNCLYDPYKPFHTQLKKLIDIYYNSIFTNCFQCKALLPYDAKPENSFINYLYLNHGEKEVSVEELEYAFSEFFENCEILDEIEQMGTALYLKNWDLSKIVSLRKQESWLEYVELLEMINKRSNRWKVDFNELELLMQRFLKCLSNENKEALDVNDIAYTFRICVGSKVLDIVKNTKIGKIMEYDGDFAKNVQAPLKVQFCIGDLTRENTEEMIFLPILLFDGMIDTTDSSTYFTTLKEFVAKQFDFIKIS